MATPEQNLQNALARADAARTKGDVTGVERWEASADRYRRIIDAKERIETSKTNLAAIRQRIEDLKKPPQTVYGTPNPSQVNPNARKKDPSEDTSNGASGGQLSVAPVPSPAPVPATPAAVTPVITIPAVPVKTAPIDTILYPSDELLPVEIMSDLIFENIGGQELINIARNDTVNGQAVVYQPIKNLTQIQQQYNPNNIVALQETSDRYFQNFAVKLETKVPGVGNGPEGAHVYIDPYTGDLVIEAINLQPDEQVELEITTSGTIYEAEL